MVKLVGKKSPHGQATPQLDQIFSGEDQDSNGFLNSPGDSYVEPRGMTFTIPALWTKSAIFSVPPIYCLHVPKALVLSLSKLNSSLTSPDCSSSITHLFGLQHHHVPTLGDSV